MPNLPRRTRPCHPPWARGTWSSRPPASPPPPPRASALSRRPRRPPGVVWLWHVQGDFFRRRGGGARRARHRALRHPILVPRGRPNVAVTVELRSNDVSWWGRNPCCRPSRPRTRRPAGDARRRRPGLRRFGGRTSGASRCDAPGNHRCPPAETTTATQPSSPSPNPFLSSSRCGRRRHRLTATYALLSPLA